MTATPIHLDVQTVARAALKAYDEGRLSAQGPSPACLYRDARGRPCAIGAAIPDDVAAAWDNADEPDIAALIDQGVVTSSDCSALARLQEEHDLWARGHSNEQSFVTLCRELAGRDDRAGG